ncbi:MAG: histidine kinase [Acidimicrobiales bacterium]
MASDSEPDGAVTNDPSRRHARWLVMAGFATWSAGLGLWETSWVGGLAATLVGGAALTIGLGSAAGGSLDSSPRMWGVSVPVAISLVLISQGVSRPEFGARVTLVGLGMLGVMLVVLHVLDERVTIERRLAQRTLTDERRRLAGEVHDVVGHTLSASMLHTTAARLALRSDPDAARASLERAEQHGRRSMDDIRSVVRLLRDDSASGSPTPLTGDVPELVEGFRSAGADIAYSPSRGLDSLPAATMLTVYRVVQEGLTNAVRHGTGTIDVAVEVRPAHSRVEIEISNAVVDRSPSARSGSGLAGMRERVGAIGGTLETGSTPGGGRWVLRAAIPT